MHQIEARVRTTWHSGPGGRRERERPPRADAAYEPAAGGDDA